MLPNWFIIFLLTVSVRMREHRMGKEGRACYPVDLGMTQAILDDACSTFQGRLQQTLPAPICYLYIVLSNNVQMSWSTERQTQQDVAVQYNTAQHREATLRMGPCILGVFILPWIIGTTASSS